MVKCGGSKSVNDSLKKLIKIRKVDIYHVIIEGLSKLSYKCNIFHLVEFDG